MIRAGERLVLRGGSVVDGVSAFPVAADVEVVDGRVCAIGVVESEPNENVIDCSGRYVLPGFVDAHSHADGAVFEEKTQLALLRQGITTVIGGQDGVSFAPGDGTWAATYFAGINGEHPTFRGGDVDALLRTYDGTTPLNFGYLIPAGTVRHEVMGMSPQAAKDTEVARMQDLVTAGMAAGALGLSTGLDYVPGAYAEADEIAALCMPVAEAGGIYVTHMRGGYESNAAAGLNEVASICAAAEVRGHVSHLHVEASDAEQLLAGIAATGIDLTFDMYPYTRGCTLVSMALLPRDYSALPVDEAVQRLASSAEREHLRRVWFPQVSHNASLGPAWPSMVRIGHTPAADWAWALGRTLAEVAQLRGTSPEDATLDLLIAARMEATAVMAVRDERSIDNLGRLFSHAGHIGGSDGIFIGAVPHPRAYGAFARYIGTYVDDWLSWQDAARHLSTRAAERFRLADRGVIGPSAVADLVVIDPNSARDLATYDSPRELATGIDDVLVAGVPVLRDGMLTGENPGRGLRRAAS